MPVTMNTFHCPNGHTFEANAKLRARCPECGASTKRGFGDLKPPAPTPPITDPKPNDPPKPKPVVKLIRQGRPRVMPVKKAPAAKKPPLKKPAKTTIPGSKVAGGLISKKRVTTAGARPGVTGRPKKTAIARHIAGGKTANEPYWHKVAGKYGF